MDTDLDDVPRNRWFGEPWPSPHLRASVCDDDRFRVPVPVGQRCLFCREPIAADHSGTIMPVVDASMSCTAQPAHKECALRNVTGNLIHVRGECTSVGACNAMSTLSYRKEALAVWAYYHQRDAADTSQYAREPQPPPRGAPHET